MILLVVTKEARGSSGCQPKYVRDDSMSSLCYILWFFVVTLSIVPKIAEEIDTQMYKNYTKLVTHFPK